jgi:hypothetical protein
MHTCEPPFATMEAWLKSYPSVEGNYGHLLLEQKIACSPELVDGLRPYFESAHLDAREHFHAQIAIDLHPDADAAGAHACYPNCPLAARHGLFGEVMAGLLTEVYQEDFVGGHTGSCRSSCSASMPTSKAISGRSRVIPNVSGRYLDVSAPISSGCRSTKMAKSSG